MSKTPNKPAPGAPPPPAKRWYRLDVMVNEKQLKGIVATLNIRRMTYVPPVKLDINK